MRQAQRSLNMASSRKWIVESATAKNALGQPTGYALLPEENAAQVEAFLARTPQARALPLDARYGRESGAGRQRLPGEEGMDGFYYALVGRDG